MMTPREKKLRAAVRSFARWHLDNDDPIKPAMLFEAIENLGRYAGWKPPKKKKT